MDLDFISFDLIPPFPFVLIYPSWRSSIAQSSLNHPWESSQHVPDVAAVTSRDLDVCVQ